MSRLIVVDECIRPRVAGQLRHRGKQAISVAQLNYKGQKDEPLLAAIAQEHPEAVFLTKDDRMPADHPQAVADSGLAIAIVDPQRPPGVPLLQWQHEVAHRWAHLIEVQPAGTVFRYGLRKMHWTDRKGKKVRRARPPTSTRLGATGYLFPP